VFGKKLNMAVELGGSSSNESGLHSGGALLKMCFSSLPPDMLG
jgi:hypothetical protein